MLTKFQKDFIRQNVDVLIKGEIKGVIIKRDDTVHVVIYPAGRPLFVGHGAELVDEIYRELETL